MSLPRNPQIGISHGEVRNHWTGLWRLALCTGRLPSRFTSDKNKAT